MIYTTVFNPALDVTFSTDALVLGETHTRMEAFQTPAGKGINVARVVRALGEAVTVIGWIPQSHLTRFKQHLEGLDIGIQLFPIPGDIRVNVTLLESARHRVTHLNALSHLPSEVSEHACAVVRSLAPRRGVFALSGSLPEGLGDDTYRILVETLKRSGNHTILDSSGHALASGIVAGPDIVKPNRAELAELFGEATGDLDDVAEKGARLLALGPRHALITLGAEGAVAVSPGEAIAFILPRIAAINTVGCGDAVVAGLAVGKARRLSFADSCRLALACGLSNALHPGAGQINREEVQGFMEQLEAEAI